MRLGTLPTILLAVCLPAFPQLAPPAWLSDAKGFCAELSRRANGAAASPPIGKPPATRFADYPARPIATPRSHAAVIGKDDWTDSRKFATAVRAAASEGPDFAGRFAVVSWSCGSWCSNSVIADVTTGKFFDTPFLGVGGCRRTTGAFDTIERRHDSALLIVRGSLEMTFGNSFGAGPCGVFYFRWAQDRLRLIGCDISNEN